MSGQLKKGPGQAGAISWLGAAYVAFAVYMIAPLTMVVLMSFKDGRFMGFPIGSFTTKWYVEVLGDGEFLAAFWYSLVVAVLSTAMALFVGIWCGVLLNRRGLFGRGILFALMCLPIVVPGVVAAISSRLFFNAVGIPPGAGALVIAHAAHSVPFVALMVLTRLSSQPPSLVEAARDLGADPFVAFMRVTVPYLMPALIGGGVFSLLFSFDDFILALFLTAFAPTLPLLLFARLFHGLSPALAAMSTIVLVMTMIIGVLAERAARRKHGK